MLLAFLTATPLNVSGGSGTFAGITTLARGLESLGHHVAWFTPLRRLPVFTAERLLFNRQLRHARLDCFDGVAGFDLDGYQVREPHVAAIKGVIADEMRFERGLTRFTMEIQAKRELLHVQRAERVLTTSGYAAGRIRELYGRDAAVVPECIDLAGWDALLHGSPATPDPRRFTILTVCRFYPRKRLPVLLNAAAQLRAKIPGLSVRIVGGGPEEGRLRALSRDLKLAGTVEFLGTISNAELAREYNACDVFCLPSVQEGFGIVFLEAMAAGKPIVASKAAAVPEVVGDRGVLVEPENAEALAVGLEHLWRSPELRAALGEASRGAVAQFDAAPVAAAFLTAAGWSDGEPANASAAKSNR